MITLNVEGMQCGRCAKRVTEIIQGLDPHASVLVDIANKTIDIDSVSDPHQLTDAVSELGFRVVGSVNTGLVAATRGCCCT